MSSEVTEILKKNFFHYKILAILYTPILTFLFILSGAFGPGLNLTDIISISIQIFVGTIIIIYLDELLRKGWGFGNGIAVFLFGTICSNLFWNTFAFQSNSFDVLPLGVITSFLQILFSSGPLDAIGETILRPSLPTHSLIALISTLIAIFLVWYISNNKLQLKNNSDFTTSESINQSNRKINFNLITDKSIEPLFIIYFIIPYIFLVASTLWYVTGQDPNNLLIGLLGTFGANEQSGQIIPNSGLVYFLTPPRGLYGQDALIPVNLAELVLSIPKTIFFLLFISIGTYNINRLFFKKKLYSINNNAVAPPFYKTDLGLITTIAISGEILGILSMGIGSVILVTMVLELYENLRSKNPSVDVKYYLLIIPLFIGFLGFFIKILLDSFIASIFPY